MSSTIKLALVTLFINIIVLHSTCGIGFKRQKRHVFQFGRMIRYTTQNSPLLYNEYGNYCGINDDEKDKPVSDNIDQCCYDHDNCYHAATKEGCPSFFIYIFRYSWSIEENRIVCNDPDTSCGKTVCRCDKNCAECFAKYQYNSKIKSPSFLDILAK